ncbi:ABC transporter permease [Clostridium sp. CF012]|uniref:ABC transporter permease n=1 Tax=Clostridium sp. CF012 TaxID=2843319 RepID=UPI001C0B9397|nr:ABC transporter permease [Clostridium sp. CF012]MBU3145779.1 ABC transporter permease [Clostridium sp. CF012]
MNIKKISFWVLILFLLIALLSPFLSSYDITNFSFDSLLSPSKYHLLGTDDMGHDLFTLLLNGFRITIFITLISGFLSTFLGSLLAVFAAHYGGFVDKVILRISDMFLMIPEIIIILFFATFSEPSLQNTLYAIVFFSWGKVFRIVRGKLMSVIEKDKIKYTLLLKGNIVDLFKKLWREIKPILTTMFILQCNKAAVYETTLSYFGIGNPLIMTWGKMLKNAMNYGGIFYDGVYFWYLLPPILCLSIFIISLSLLTFDES